MPLCVNIRPVLLPSKLAVKREYSSLMTVKRRKTFGRIRRSAMQLKLNPDPGMQPFLCGNKMAHIPSFVFGLWILIQQVVTE